jgi:hypothetical protein
MNETRIKTGNNEQILKRRKKVTMTRARSAVYFRPRALAAQHSRDGISAEFTLCKSY